MMPAAAILQIDDTAWAYLCSQAELKKARDRGLNADRLAAGLRQA